MTWLRCVCVCMCMCFLSTKPLNMKTFGVCLLVGSLPRLWLRDSQGSKQHIALHKQCGWTHRMFFRLRWMIGAMHTCDVPYVYQGSCMCILLIESLGTFNFHLPKLERSKFYCRHNPLLYLQQRIIKPYWNFNFFLVIRWPYFKRQRQAVQNIPE